MKAFPISSRHFRNTVSLLILCVSFSYSQWKQIPGTAGHQIPALVAIGDTVVAASMDSLCLLSQGGEFRRMSLPGNSGSRVVALARDDQFIYASTGHAIYRSALASKRWNIIATSPKNVYCSLAASEGNVIVGTSDGTAELFSGRRATHTTSRVAGRETQIRVLLAGRESWIAGSLGEGVFFTDHLSRTWRSHSKGLKNLFIYSLSGDGSDILAGTVSGSVFRLRKHAGRWVRADDGLPYTAIRSLIVFGSTCLAGTWGKGVYRADVMKFEWREVSEGFISDGSGTINAIVAAGAYFYAATDDGLWRRPVAELAIPMENRSSGGIPQE
jgi:hypothetical protein